MQQQQNIDMCTTSISASQDGGDVKDEENGMDDSFVSDTHGEDHSKLLSDCFDTKEQTNVQIEKYKNSNINIK